MEGKHSTMLSQWYDPILIVGIERTLPARLASLLDVLGVDVWPMPVHLDATVTRWEDHEVRQCLMKLLSGGMSLCTFNLRLAILNEQRRRSGKPWAIASSYLADVPLPVLSHYLNPSVLWCQSTPRDAADLLLSVQPATTGWSPSDALELCTKRHQTLTRWLPGYRVCHLEAEHILVGDPQLIDDIVEFCGIAPTVEQHYQACAKWVAMQGESHGQEEEYAALYGGRD